MLITQKCFFSAKIQVKTQNKKKGCTQNWGGFSAKIQVKNKKKGLH